MRIRPASPNDIPAMMRLERESPSAAHWSQQQYEGVLAGTDEQALSHRIAWIVDEAGSLAIGPMREGEILAFLIARRTGREWELENIVVAKDARRRGVGTGLLEEFIGYAREQRATVVFLEVRPSNEDARRLYRKLGFEETELRKKYYADPQEDAIICQLRIC